MATPPGPLFDARPAASASLTVFRHAVTSSVGFRSVARVFAFHPVRNSMRPPARSAGKLPASGIAMNRISESARIDRHRRLEFGKRPSIGCIRETFHSEAARAISGVAMTKQHHHFQEPSRVKSLSFSGRLPVLRLVMQNYGKLAFRRRLRDRPGRQVMTSLRPSLSADSVLRLPEVFRFDCSRRVPLVSLPETGVACQIAFAQV